MFTRMSALPACVAKRRQNISCSREEEEEKKSKEQVIAEKTMMTRTGRATKKVKK